MSDHSSIEWTNATWNPVTGCTKVSAGCKNCLDPGTRILMADMSWRPIGDVLVGDRVVSFTESPAAGQNRVYEEGIVEAVWETRKPAVEITAGNRAIVCSEDHLLLTYTRPQWKKAGTLALSSGIIDIGMPVARADPTAPDYLDGYASGAIEGDGTFRWQPGWRSDKKGFPQSYCRVAVLTEDRPILERIEKAFQNHGLDTPSIKGFDSGRPGRPLIKLETRALANLELIDTSILPERAALPWRMGWLAGFFDTDGCYSGKNLRFSQKSLESLLQAERFASQLGFTLKIEDRTDTSTCSSAIVVGSLEDRIRFLATIRPALTRKCADFMGRRFPKTWTRVDGIRNVGQSRLIDIQVDKRTFIAEGFATHNCYAERFAERFRDVPGHPFEQGFDVRLWPERLDIPLRWRTPRLIFVNSMSDLFHPEVPDDFIQKAFATMEAASQHTFQILTKRPERVVDLADGLPWPANVWMGVSVEDGRVLGRIDRLRQVPATVRFLSCEPLIGSLSGLNLAGIDWVIVGGESGPGARAMRREWVHELRQECRKADVPFFFKQWGGVIKSRTGRELDGKTYDEMPSRAFVNSRLAIA